MKNFDRRLSEASYKVGENLSVWFKHHKFTQNQQVEIILGIENNINVGDFANPSYTVAQMRKMRIHLQGGPSYDKLKNINKMIKKYHFQNYWV